MFTADEGGEEREERRQLLPEGCVAETAHSAQGGNHQGGQRPVLLLARHQD